jgi:hypothetical protein
MGQVLIGHHRRPVIDRDDRTTWTCRVALDSSPEGNEEFKSRLLPLIVSQSLRPPDLGPT